MMTRYIDDNYLDAVNTFSWLLSPAFYKELKQVLETGTRSERKLFLKLIKDSLEKDWERQGEKVDTVEFKCLRAESRKLIHLSRLIDSVS